MATGKSKSKSTCKITFMTKSKGSKRDCKSRAPGKTTIISQSKNRSKGAAKSKAYASFRSAHAKSGAAGSGKTYGSFRAGASGMSLHSSGANKNELNESSKKDFDDSFMKHFATGSGGHYSYTPSLALAPTPVE